MRSGRKRSCDFRSKLSAADAGTPRIADELMDKRGKPKNMCEVLDRAEERGRKMIQLLRKWVRSDRISIESAAEEIGMTVDAFRKEAKL